jgi:ArsR family transcriptional regulator, arsenate/arsenite/antimonite-responsive transcriptional repressor
MDKIKQLAQYYKILADETRLLLIQLLSQQEPGKALCVGSLAKRLKTSPPNISQHLNQLKNLKLVQSNRSGYRVHYYLNEEQFGYFAKLKNEILEQYIHTPNPLSQTEENTMNDKEPCNCKHPDHNPSPKDCTPEQIEECHGDNSKSHPCEKEPCGCNH